MRQEYGYRTEAMEVIVFVFLLLLPIILFPDLISYFYHHENNFLIINFIFSWIVLCLLLVSPKIAQQFSHLILKDDGIEVISPILDVEIPWKKVRVIEIRSRYGRQFSIYSPDMVITRTPIGSIMPSTIDKMIVRRGIPISKYLGNDLEDILKILSAYPEFQNKP